MANCYLFQTLLLLSTAPYMVIIMDNFIEHLSTICSKVPCSVYYLLVSFSNNSLKKNRICLLAVGSV